VNQKWLFTFKDLEGAEVKELVELKDIQQQTKELQLDKVEIEKDDCVLKEVNGEHNRIVKKKKKR